jgi:hypothetical protein
MQADENPVSSQLKRTPWNKGKLIGPKPPLRPKHVWSIRTKLQVEGRTRDLAMFNLAIDSKLRGCDVVALKVEDVAPRGYTVERATVRQKKTSRPPAGLLREDASHLEHLIFDKKGHHFRKANSFYLAVGETGNFLALNQKRAVWRLDVT